VTRKGSSRRRLKWNRAVTLGALVAAMLLALVGSASAATLTPNVWSAAPTTSNGNEIMVKVEGAACKGYDLSMVDRLQLKDQYSSAAAFYDYEPALLDPDPESVEGLYEGPVLVQGDATNGLHHILVYCNENDFQVGEFDVTIVHGKSPKPKKCKKGTVKKNGQCVKSKGPQKVPHP
jgi:hypothetical protein